MELLGRGVQNSIKIKVGKEATAPLKGAHI